MLTVLHGGVLAGINFDVTIRGVLVVLVAVAVLMGSVWLIISTNTGTRLGTLIALSSFFAWMTIMASAWWIFGIGWKGADPSWKIINVEPYGDLQRSSLEVARNLPNDILPGQTPYEFVRDSGSQAAIKEYASPIPQD